MQLMTILAMITAAAGVVFALQNQESVAVSLIAWRFEASLAIILLLALAVGGFVVGLVSTPSTVRRQLEIRRQQKRIEELELRIETLRSENTELRAEQRRSQPEAGAAAAASPYKEMPDLIAARPGDGDGKAG
ncbi:MAG: DUF1049 domain-containing protein [Rhodocyclaceae bacterium]|nr:DUF1049 domain-containing protein [Rhodocyclaceae bacterium]